MKNLIATLTTAAILGSGCAASNSSSFPEGHITGYDFAEKSQSDNPYKLERVTIYGDQFYAQETDSTEKRDGALPFVFIPFNKATRELDLNSGEVELISGKKYMPVQVEVDNYTQNKWADEVELALTGKRGIKADILQRNNGEDTNGLSFVTTENDASYTIKTMKILGNKYFFPHAGQANSEGKLDFYLIPLQGAKLKIRNSDGGITIRNEDQIYMPILVESLPKIEAKYKKSSGEVEKVNN